jgi:hypothetical protein
MRDERGEIDCERLLFDPAEKLPTSVVDDPQLPVTSEVTPMRTKFSAAGRL